MQDKRVIIVYWKTKPKNPIEVYSSLKNFCLANKQYNYNTLSNYLSKRKVPFENDEVRIERKIVITKPASEKATPVRKLVPIVRKVLLKDADEARNDLEYWLSRPPAERVAAATFIVSQSLKQGQRLDKRKIVKRKLKA